MTPHATHAMRPYLGELRHLFDSMDSAPFRERDLDPKAAGIELSWALLGGRPPDPASDQACQDGLLQKRWGMSPADCDHYEQVLRAFGKLKLALALIRVGIARERVRAARAPTDHSTIRSRGLGAVKFGLASACASIPPIRAPSGRYRLCGLCEASASHENVGMSFSAPSGTHRYVLFDQRTRSVAHHRSRAAWTCGLF